MRLLLDTHAMYWYIEGDAKLSHAARTLIQDASNDVFISPVSYWEIAIKVSLWISAVAHFADAYGEADGFGLPADSQRPL